MAVQDDLRVLSSLAAFGDLEPDALRLVAFSAETRILRVGDILFRAGEKSDGGYILLSGELELETVAGATVVVTPPTLLGEAALLTTTLRPATAKARAPSSVLAVSRDLYRRVLSEYPESAKRMHGAITMRLKAMEQRFEQLDA